MEKRPRTQGMIGFIALLVSVAVLMLLFTKAYFTPPAVTPGMDDIQPPTASGTPARTNIEQMHADVDSARKVQDEAQKYNVSIENSLNE